MVNKQTSQTRKRKKKLERQASRKYRDTLVEEYKKAHASKYVSTWNMLWTKLTMVEALLHPDKCIRWQAGWLDDNEIEADKTAQWQFFQATDYGAAYDELIMANHKIYTTPCFFKLGEK